MTEFSTWVQQALIKHQRCIGNDVCRRLYAAQHLLLRLMNQWGRQIPSATKIVRTLLWLLSENFISGPEVPWGIIKYLGFTETERERGREREIFYAWINWSPCCNGDFPKVTQPHNLSIPRDGIRLRFLGFLCSEMGSTSLKIHPLRIDVLTT